MSKVNQVNVANLSSLALAVRNLCGDKEAAAALLRREMIVGVANVLKHGNDKPLKEAAATALQAPGKVAALVAPLLVEMLALRKAKDTTHDDCDAFAAAKVDVFMQAVVDGMVAIKAAQKTESEAKKAEKEAATKAEAAKLADDHAAAVQEAKASRSFALADVLAFIGKAEPSELDAMVAAVQEAAAAWKTIDAEAKAAAARRAASDAEAKAAAAAAVAADVAAKQHNDAVLAAAAAPAPAAPVDAPAPVVGKAKRSKKEAATA